MFKSFLSQCLFLHFFLNVIPITFFSLLFLPLFFSLSIHSSIICADFNSSISVHTLASVHPSALLYFPHTQTVHSIYFCTFASFLVYFHSVTHLKYQLFFIISVLSLSSFLSCPLLFLPVFLSSHPYSPPCSCSRGAAEK